MPRKRVRFDYSERLNKKKSPKRRKATQSGQKEYWYNRVNRRQNIIHGLHRKVR